MSTNDELHEAIFLQRYCDGSCTALAHAHIEGNPDLLARGATILHLDISLQELFSAAAALGDPHDSLSLQALIDCVDGTISQLCHQFVE